MDGIELGLAWKPQIFLMNGTAKDNKVINGGCGTQYLKKIKFLKVRLNIIVAILQEKKKDIAGEKIQMGVLSLFGLITIILHNQTSTFNTRVQLAQRNLNIITIIKIGLCV